MTRPAALLAKANSWCQKPLTQEAAKRESHWRDCKCSVPPRARLEAPCSRCRSPSTRPPSKESSWFSRNCIRSAAGASLAGGVRDVASRALVAKRVVGRDCVFAVST
jgi:hypothetical protein